MVDFSSRATEISTRIEPAAALVQPVDRGNEIDALNQIADGVGKAAKVFSTFRTNQANLANNKYLTDYNIRLIDAEQAFAQGQWSPSEYRTRVNALLSSAIAGAPDLRDDILNDTAKFFTRSGISSVKSQGQEEYEAYQASKAAALEGGWLSIADINNPQKVAEAISKKEEFNAAMTNMERVSKEIALKSSGMELDAKTAAAREKQVKNMLTSNLSTVAVKFAPTIETAAKDIQTRMAQAGSEEEKEQIRKEGIFNMQKVFQEQVMNTAAGVVGYLDQATVDMVVKPLQETLDLHVKNLSGEMDNELFKKKVEGLKLRQQALLLPKIQDDPQLMQWVVASDLLGAAAPEMPSDMLLNILDRVFKNSSTTGKPTDNLPADEAETEATRNYYTGVKELAGAFNSGKLGDAENQAKIKEELNTQIANIYKGITKYGPGAESAKEFQPTIDLLASPEMGEYLKTNGLPANLADDVKTVIQTGYEQEVLPAIRAEMDKVVNEFVIPTPMPGETMPTMAAPGLQLKTERVGNLITPTFENGRVGFKLSGPIPPGFNEFTVKKALKAANEGKAIKLINKLNIAKTHMDGNSDYKSTWENDLMPRLFPEAQATGDQSSLQQTQQSVEVASIDNNLLSEVAAASTDLEFSQNEDVVQEVMDAAVARQRTPGIAGILDPDTFAATYGDVEVSSKRGYTPDISNVKPEVLDKFKQLQASFGKKLPVVSGFRSPSRNKKAGGAKKSQHIHGNALDIDVSELGRSERIELIRQAKALGFKGIGVYANSIHIDMGGERAWGPTYHKESLPKWAELVLKE